MARWTVVILSAAGLLLGSRPAWTQDATAIGGRMGEASAAPTDRPSAANERRDPDIAVREEFTAAKAEDTVSAYRLFIRRHPDHALAEKAREKVRELKRDADGDSD